MPWQNIAAHAVAISRGASGLKPKEVRKLCGVIPVIRRNTRQKWLWSAKPVSMLISAIEASGESSRSHAVRIRKR
jgi:hypothetical protein